MKVYILIYKIIYLLKSENHTSLPYYNMDKTSHQLESSLMEVSSTLYDKQRHIYHKEGSKSKVLNDTLKGNCETQTNEMEILIYIGLESR